jgi:UDP-glucose 4-epimerase
MTDNPASVAENRQLLMRPTVNGSTTSDQASPIPLSALRGHVDGGAPSAGRFTRDHHLEVDTISSVAGPPRTVLVTGGSGFIGSHLVDALLARGDRVIALDSLSSGRLQNLDAARSDPRFRFVQGSVLDELVVDELVHECDAVVHLAAAVGVKLIVEQPLRSLTTNIRGSENVIGAAHRYRRKILLASTSEIYGKNGSGPLKETDDRILGSPSVARWAYSTAKAVDEILAFAYHKERGLPSIVLRLFNTVGPRQSPAYGMVLPRLMRQALRHEPVTVFGDGTQTRCFCHVKDVIDAMLRLLDHPGAIGEAFNVGSSEEISILGLAQRVIEVTKSRSPIDLIPYEEAYGSGFEDMLRRVPDTSKLRRLTGWGPNRTLTDILRETTTEAASEQAALVNA